MKIPAKTNEILSRMIVLNREIELMQDDTGEKISLYFTRKLT